MLAELDPDWNDFVILSLCLSPAWNSRIWFDVLLAFVEI